MKNQNDKEKKTIKKNHSARCYLKPKKDNSTLDGIKLTMTATKKRVQTHTHLHTQFK